VHALCLIIEQLGSKFVPLHLLDPSAFAEHNAKFEQSDTMNKPNENNILMIYSVMPEPPRTARGEPYFGP